MNRIVFRRNRVSEMDDEALIAAVAASDHSALRELYDRHAPWLAARLRRILPPEAVEDVIQETFIAVWRGAGGYVAAGAVGAWIWGIGRRHAALWLRRQGRPETILEEATSPVSESHAATVERWADLQQALAALGPDADEQRELLRLVYVEDRPLAEVAKRLGVPEGTVKSRLFKVRSRLRAELQGGG